MFHSWHQPEYCLALVWRGQRNFHSSLLLGMSILTLADQTMPKRLAVEASWKQHSKLPWHPQQRNHQIQASLCPSNVFLLVSSLPSFLSKSVHLSTCFMIFIINCFYSPKCFSQFSWLDFPVFCQACWFCTCWTVSLAGRRILQQTWGQQEHQMPGGSTGPHPGMPPLTWAGGWQAWRWSCPGSLPSRRWRRTVQIVSSALAVWTDLHQKLQHKALFLLFQHQP